MENKRVEILSNVYQTVANYRSQYGNDICSDVVVAGDIAQYTFCPEDVAGYIHQTNLVTGLSRHCGLGRGCFWTDWE